MGKDVIIALDFPGREETLAFLDRFTGKKPFVKIGMELFYAEGPQIVREIKRRGHKIFLDLKLCDIPNTVKGGMRSLSQLDVDMTNLHAFGTIAMMEAALEGLTRPDGTRPLLIAVTQLTSTDQMRMEKELLIEKPLPEVVMHYAELARTAGLDGVVCSPLEAGEVHRRCGENFVTVTPGVRFAGGDTGDQKRVTTRKRPANWARTTSSSAAPSPKRKTPWKPTSAACKVSSDKEEKPWNCKRGSPATCSPSARFSCARSSPSPGPAASKAPFTAITASRSPRRRCAWMWKTASPKPSATTTRTAKC